MAICVKNILFFASPLNTETSTPSCFQFTGCSLSPKRPVNFAISESHNQQQPLLCDANAEENSVQNFKWIKIGPDVTEAQKQAISQLPFKMTKRCQAVMKQIICATHLQQNASLADLLGRWVRIMKPRRADWLSVLKQLKQMDHPLYLQVAEFAMLEESFEANVRDYTKVIHCYGKQNQLQEAEKTLLAMKERGFVADQVILTTMIDIYSKSGNLNQAEIIFEELKLLGYPLDKRAYGSMIMAYIRAGMPENGETLLREMDAIGIYAGTEVYKALLRAYSMVGNADGAQRVFDAIQFACIPPDARVCGVLINAYLIAGQNQKALIAFENMRRVGIEPNDKCIALALAAYEKENRLSEALQFLIGLESEGIMVGKGASQILVGWFRNLGVVKEVELVLREHAAKGV